MSVLLNGTTQWVEGLASPINSYPLTINVWYKTSSIANQGVLSYDANGVVNSWFHFELRNAGFINRVRQRWSALANNSLSGSFTQDAWEMLTAVYESQSSQRAYRNGGSESIDVSDAGAPSFGSLTHLRLGRIFATVGGNEFEGRLAEFAIWSVGLSSAEIAALYGGGGDGLPATDLYPGSVEFYATYESDFTSTVGPSLTPVGGASIDADHPSISGGGPPPSGGVSWDQFTPSNLRRCWHDGQGNLKPSCTTSLYGGGNPGSPADLKASIVDVNGFIRKGMTNSADNDLNAQMKPPA